MPASERSCEPEMSYLRRLGQASQKGNMMMVQFDRVVNAFVVPAGVASGEIDGVCAKLNEALAKIRVWLNKKKCNGKYSRIFLVELSIEYVDRRYDMHNIYDEIGKLEGTDIRPSRTKPAEPFKRPPLRGLCDVYSGNHSGCRVSDAGESAKRFMQRLGLRGMRRPKPRSCGLHGWIAYL